MTPVANSTCERGQISIFFSASIVVLISIVAFVINIGLFVKAKINLQNATDAAAYSGAAVQARQLSKIAYLNWEMRNIYKEWMYKYYVIGNLNIADVENPTGGTTMSYRLQADTNPITGAQTKDPYNIPAVCIHLANSKTNICKRYAIPGLPEFGSSNLPGAEEASRAFMDVLISSKVNDCIDRTRLNMLVALTWAYNVLADNSLDNILVKQGPAILANRQGAWPKAVELAMRMRNLELAVNRKPESGVCASPGSLPSCNKSINTITQDKNLGSERIVKAYFSAYRNLGNEVDSEMKDSFTLTEISPKVVGSNGNINSASYLLIPESSAKSNKADKYYLDLRLMMVNYAVFYAAMIPRADSATSGACDVSKVAIPVPGYPLGFYKNPDVLTYYAVRGQALFSGMFNPFDSEEIPLTAYAAAKPFGGRIGPQLFIQPQNTDYFVGRGTSNKLRSIPYISTLDLSKMPARGGKVLGNNNFIPGLPLPINFDGPPGYFWLKDAASPLGGVPKAGADVQFGIPNLVYDYQTQFKTDGYTAGGVKIHTITPDPTVDQTVGLFSKAQFANFKGTALTNNIQQDTLENEIARVRAPTLYEAANYLIPSHNTLNIANGLDSFGVLSGQKIMKGSTEVYTSNVYAPLYSPDQQDVYWKNSTDVVGTIYEFMRRQQSAVDKYRSALNMGAKSIYDMRNSVAAEAGGSRPGYEKAARGVSDINFELPGGSTAVMGQTPGSCASLAGQFLEFFYGGGVITGASQVINNTGCPMSLGNMLQKYFSTTNAINFSADHYKFEYSFNPGNLSKGRATPKSLSIFSAYMPGPFTGVALNGMFTNALPSSGITENTHRNFYSTKLITLDSLQKNRPGYDQSVVGFPIYSEGDLQKTSDEAGQKEFKNTLDAQAQGIDLNGITY